MTHSTATATHPILTCLHGHVMAERMRSRHVDSWRTVALPCRSRLPQLFTRGIANRMPPGPGSHLVSNRESLVRAPPDGPPCGMGKAAARVGTLAIPPLSSASHEGGHIQRAFIDAWKRSNFFTSAAVTDLRAFSKASSK